ncbi:MAG: ABC transporter permease [Lachnospiraceae bacterium]|jgi:putative ABC transport system permease protein
MKLLRNLIIKNLKLNKKRTIVSIIGIVLSVALITAVSSMYMSGIKSLIKYTKATRGDFHVMFEDVKDSEIATLQNNRSVEKINVSKDLGYAKVDSKNEYKPYIFVKALEKDSFDGLSVKLIEGNLPENGNEIVIPNHLKSNGKVEYKIGDRITVDLSKRLDFEDNELNQDAAYNFEDGEIFEKLEKIETKEYKVVGIIDRPVRIVEPYSAPGYTALTAIDEKEYQGNYDLYVSFEKEKIKDIYKIIGDLINVDYELLAKSHNLAELTAEDSVKLAEQMSKAKYKVNFNYALFELETNPINASGIKGLSGAAVIVMIIIVFASVFVIRNSFDISVTEKTRQYGMLRSIGATKKQIRSTVFKEASILGAIAIPIGILTGLLATFLLIVISNYLIGEMFTDGLILEFSFSAIAIVVSILLGMITIYLSAITGAAKASKVSPIDSIRSSFEIKTSSKRIKTPGLISKLFGVGGAISYKNLKRSKRKYRTTTISIIVSVIIFITLSSFTSLMFGEADRVFEGNDYNISISLESKSKEAYNKLLEISRFDHIEDYSIIRVNDIKFSSEHLSDEYKDYLEHQAFGPYDSEHYYAAIMSIGDKQFEKYLQSIKAEKTDFYNKAVLIDTLEYNFIDANGNEATEYIRLFDLSENDIIKASIADTDKEFDITVGKVAEEKPFGLDKSATGVFIVNDDYFDEIATPRFMDLYIYSNNPEELVKNIEECLKDETYYLFDKSRQVKEMNNFSLLVSIFLYGFIAVITLIGVTNIFNTITTNMQLRRREFATLKSIGMTTKEFNRMIRLESLFMGAKSLIIGIPIGVILSLTIQYFIKKGTDLPYNIPAPAICISIMAVFILIMAIMKYSINEINKQNMIETIRSENI